MREATKRCVPEGQSLLKNKTWVITTMQYLWHLGNSEQLVRNLASLRPGFCWSRGMGVHKKKFKSLPFPTQSAKVNGFVNLKQRNEDWESYKSAGVLPSQLIPNG